MAKHPVKRINLALQGGGAHGAYTWGVLDRLLQEHWLDFAAISGTSAGAVNGAAVQAGLAAAKGRNGRRAARENLAHVWSEIGQVSDSRVVRWMHSFFPAPRSLERMTALFSPFTWYENLTRLFSITVLVYLVFVLSSIFPSTTIRQTCATRLSISISSQRRALSSPVRIPQ